MQNKIRKFFPVILIFLLIASVLLSLFCGVEAICFSDIFNNSISRTIFLKLRLPRTLLCIVTGFMLAGSGCLFQMFFSNPLAEPGIMGISSGATLGAVLISCLVPSVPIIVNFGAFMGAVAAGLIVIILSFSKRGYNSTVTVLLMGTVLGSFYSAVTSILLSINDKKLHSMYMWMLGSFSGRSWNELKLIIIPFIAALIMQIFCGLKLDFVAGGEVVAQSLGVQIKVLRVQILVTGALSTSVAVCCGGTIGFVGLVAPHIVRKIYGFKMKNLLPYSMVTGAILLLLSDILARIVIQPAELPVGIIMSLIGVPFFISIFKSRP